MSQVVSVYTKYGWVSREGLWRLKEAYKLAIRNEQAVFEIDGQTYFTRFAGYLIEYCQDEGLVPVATKVAAPIFQPEQGHA